MQHAELLNNNADSCTLIFHTLVGNRLPFIYCCICLKYLASYYGCIIFWAKK